MIRAYLIWLYIFFNISCAIYFGAIGKLGGDFKYEYPADVYLLVLSCFITIFTFILVQGVIFKVFERVRIRRRCSFNNTRKLDIFILVLVSLAVVISIFFKVGVLGVDKSITDDVPKIVLYFNTMFQPVFLVLIYLFYKCDSNRLIYFLIYILYVILVILNGQTAQLLILFCLFLMRKSLKGKKYNFLNIMLLTLGGLAFYPFVRMIKDAIVHSVNSKSGLADTLSMMIDGLSPEKYFDYLFITLERFQMVSNTYFIIDNGERLSSLFSHEGFSSSFYSLHWLVSAIARLLGMDTSNILSAQDFFAFYINGVSTWSSQIGVLGYFFFYNYYSIIIIVSILIILFLSVRLSAVLNKGNELVELTWCMTLLLVCHGWFLPFINYFQSLIVFFLLVLSLNARKVYYPQKGNRC
ncbi:lipopolysaccharide biosynthesis polymerase, putative [Enterobacteriaceae bacterium bta3-1]|nr:lipopolysaccharide biosynthesis polymerase, putative [Enterobacteriaceae bacterium bta3-1]